MLGTIFQPPYTICPTPPSLLQLFQRDSPDFLVFLLMIIFVQGSEWAEQLLSATVIYQVIFIWLSLQGTEAFGRLFSSFKHPNNP